MSILGIEPTGFTPAAIPQINSTLASSPTTGAVAGTSATSGADFGNLVLDGLNRLEGLNDNASSLAVQAATGKLTNIHDYTIAATQASVATQLTVAVRNKAVEAFNEIMRMPV